MRAIISAFSLSDKRESATITARYQTLLPLFIIATSLSAIFCHQSDGMMILFCEPRIRMTADIFYFVGSGRGLFHYRQQLLMQFRRKKFPAVNQLQQADNFGQRRFIGILQPYISIHFRFGYENFRLAEAYFTAIGSNFFTPPSHLIKISQALLSLSATI